MKTVALIAVRAIAGVSLTCGALGIAFIGTVVFAPGPVLAQAVNFFQQSTVNVVVRTLIPKLRERLTLTDFAVGDGTTDDTAALNRALAVQTSTGLRLDGLSRTYAVSGDITLPDKAWLENVKVKQLIANVQGRRTLVCMACTSITLKNVTVNRNGAPTDRGTLGTNFGIFISGADAEHPVKFRGENIEIYGDGPGTAIRLKYADAPYLLNTYVHDIAYQKMDNPCTEQITGIDIVGDGVTPTNALIVSSRIERLGGVIINGVPSAGSSCSSGKIIGFVDDGKGVGSPSGVAGNVLTVSAVIAGTVTNAAVNSAAGNIATNTKVTGQLSGTAGGVGKYTVNNLQLVPSETMALGASWSAPGATRYFQTIGFLPHGVIGLVAKSTFVSKTGKGIAIASTDLNRAHVYRDLICVDLDGICWETGHQSEDVSVQGGSCLRCGYTAAAVFGGAISDTQGAINPLIKDFYALDTGANGHWIGASVKVSGFSLLHTTKFGVVGGLCINCFAYDRQKRRTMQYGFVNETRTSTNALLLINPRVNGAVVAPYFNFLPAAIYPIKGQRKR